MSSGFELNFTQEELEKLNLAISLAVTGDSNKTFSDFVESYRAFVESLSGYRFSIYDYDNDLSVREILDRALNACDGSLKEKAEGALQELDETFFARTVEYKRTQYSDHAETSARWYNRLPRNPGKELKEDIESNNF